MPKVFISYRRADSAPFAGRIYDRLVLRLQQANVFKDVDDIPPGVDFARYIQDALGLCAAVLVLIGRGWLTARGADGARRLDDPADFVRLEIALALSAQLTVIPVLVDGASMPPAAELPEELRPLALRNAVAVRDDPDFSRDMERVLAALARAGAVPPARTPAVTPLVTPVVPAQHVPAAPAPASVRPADPYPAVSTAYRPALAPGPASPPAYAAAAPRRAVPAGPVPGARVGWGTVVGIGLACDVPLVVVAILARIVFAVMGDPAAGSLWVATLVSVAAGAVQWAAYLVAGSVLARRTGRIGASILAAVVAALPIGLLLLPVAVTDVGSLVWTLALVMASVPLGALGGAIGRRATKAPSGTRLGSQQARPR
jgi:hypothetical protein